MKASQSATSVVGVNGKQTKARKTARVSNPTISTSQVKGIFFAECDGEKFVELTSLAKQVQKKQGDRALASIWRRAGYDAYAMNVEHDLGVDWDEIRRRFIRRGAEAPHGRYQPSPNTSL